MCQNGGACHITGTLITENPLLLHIWAYPIIGHPSLPYYHSSDHPLLSLIWSSAIITHLAIILNIPCIGSIAQSPCKMEEHFSIWGWHLGIMYWCAVMIWYLFFWSEDIGSIVQSLGRVLQHFSIWGPPSCTMMWNGSAMVFLMAEYRW